MSESESKLNCLCFCFRVATYADDLPFVCPGSVALSSPHRDATGCRRATFFIADTVAGLNLGPFYHRTKLMDAGIIEANKDRLSDPDQIKVGQKPRIPDHEAGEGHGMGRGGLHQLVRDHFESFRAQVAHVRDGQGLPRFVEPSSSAAACALLARIARRARDPPGPSGYEHSES